MKLYQMPPGVSFWGEERDPVLGDLPRNSHLEKEKKKNSFFFPHLLYKMNKCFNKWCVLCSKVEPRETKTNKININKTSGCQRAFTGIHGSSQGVGGELQVLLGSPAGVQIMQEAVQWERSLAPSPAPPPPRALPQVPPPQEHPWKETYRSHLSICCFLLVMTPLPHSPASLKTKWAVL